MGSQVSIDIIATITRGGDWPCGEGRAPLGSVIVLSAEDGAGDTIVPRLIAAGADRTRVHIVSAVMAGDDGRRTFNLQADLALLEAKIRQIGDVALIVVDPVSSYMGKTDSHKNSEVRSVLEPIGEMAERLRVAVLTVTHFSKGGANSTTKALHRFIGSIAFTGAPRAAFAVIEDAENEGRRLFLSVKNNIAAPPQGLAFRLEQRIVGEIGEGIVASHVTWDLEPVAISANEAMAADGPGQGGRTATAEAEEFLRDVLADGPVAANDVKAQAAEAGLSWATLRRAKDRLGIKPTKAGMGGGWQWNPPKVLTEAEDAHVYNVSPFGENEHLRADPPPASPPPVPVGGDLCCHCGKPGGLLDAAVGGVSLRLHRGCIDAALAAADDGLDGIPPFLRRAQ